MIWIKLNNISIILPWWLCEKMILPKRITNLQRRMSAHFGEPQTKNQHESDLHWAESPRFCWVFRVFYRMPPAPCCGGTSNTTWRYDGGSQERPGLHQCEQTVPRSWIFPIIFCGETNHILLTWRSGTNSFQNRYRYLFSTYFISVSKVEPQ